MLHYSKIWMVAALCLVSFTFLACQHHADEAHAEHPAEVEHIEGSEISRVTLTDKAMERIDVKTTEITMQADGSGTQQKVVPYSALIYDPEGETWIYTSPSPKTFVRAKVEVDYIEGDQVVLKQGPPAGTVIANVGVAELYGTEFEVGH